MFGSVSISLDISGRNKGWTLKTGEFNLGCRQGTCSRRERENLYVDDVSIMKENNIIRHYETPPKHTDKEKYNNMNMEQSLKKVQELIRSPKSQQAMFTKRDCCQGQLYCGRTGYKSAGPFTEGEFVNHCMLKVCDTMWLEKRQFFLMWVWPETPSLKVHSSFQPIWKIILWPRENISSHTLLLWMKRLTRLTFPSCQISSVGSTQAWCE